MHGHAWWIVSKGIIEHRSETPRVPVRILGATNVLLLAHFVDIVRSYSRLSYKRVKRLTDPLLELMNWVRKTHSFFVLGAPMGNIDAFDLIADPFSIIHAGLLVEVDEDHVSWVWIQ